MKKLINDPSHVVREMLEGVVLLNPGAAILSNENVVVRADLPEPGDRKVSVISGGGSGHEPAHAGYVGLGMLAAAVAGDVFTSPSTDAVLAGIRAVSGPAGALLIVKNYTGDRLNFGLAAEMARADGIPVEMVVVADDVALRDTVTKDRRRGIAGTVLVHKVAGAAADKGLPLEEVARIARDAADNVASMGISLGPCTLPAVGKPGFKLGADEIEVGLGIHGEQGVRRMTMGSADDLCRLILDTMAADRAFSNSESVALLVNGLGTTPPMELAIIAQGALRQLQAMDVCVKRAWCGTLLSALDMPGFSLSVLRLDGDLIDLLDAPTNAPSWPGSGQVNTEIVAHNAGDRVERLDEPGEQSLEGRLLHELAKRAARAMIVAEPKLTELDSITGDGDLGTSMKRGAEAILSLSASEFTTPASGLASIGNTLRRVIGGSSGPFYATALLRASRYLADIPQPSSLDWARAFAAAVQAVSDLGGAKPGDRTMVDALKPAAETLNAISGEDLSPAQRIEAMADAALSGAEATRNMRPRLGRASYLGDRALGHPDGGAVAVALWMKAVATEG
ncbi:MULTISPECIES: dihydroxyacetone kinase subunit DhaL [unclassified Sinorhizobium]|uniref:dihydroxyacetone kinase subunit DhaL n=1 Tax=unclassified Sinorhizobium TaxID=2613772 RepID=UPI003524EB1F